MYLWYERDAGMLACFIISGIILLQYMEGTLVYPILLSSCGIILVLGSLGVSIISGLL